MQIFKGGGPPIVAFFDLDRTLLDLNSGALYARQEYEEGRIGRWQLVKAFLWLGLYHFSMVDVQKAYDKAVAHSRGEPTERMRERTVRLFDGRLRGRLRPGGRRALDQHRAAGHGLVLLTSSSCYLADEATRAWGLDGWIANHFPTDPEGRLLGRVEPPLCYGRGKVERAERWAAETGAELDECYFYTDSYSDLPMLERVGHPRAVHPDPRLRREAARRGWPILDWGRA